MGDDRCAEGSEWMEGLKSTAAEYRDAGCDAVEGRGSCEACACAMHVSQGVDSSDSNLSVASCYHKEEEFYRHL
jgi:hypothetical protein